MAKTTYSREELEQQLSESRREFLAADATINNLELKLAEMAAQLANAENKCAAMAADNEKAMEAMRQADAAVKLAHEKFSAMAAENAALKESEREFDKMCAEEFGPDWVSEFTETPATDAFLDEVRAHGVDMARNAMIDFVDGEVGPNKNVPGLIRGAEICVSIADQLRKGVLA